MINVKPSNGRIANASGGRKEPVVRATISHRQQLQQQKYQPKHLNQKQPILQISRQCVQRKVCSYSKSPSSQFKKSKTSYYPCK